VLAVCADVVPGYVAGAPFDAHELLLSILDRTACCSDAVDCRLERKGKRQSIFWVFSVYSNVVRFFVCLFVCVPVRLSVAWELSLLCTIALLLQCTILATHR